MPVTPPRFGISLPNPASLIQRDRESPIDRAFNQILNFSLQEKGAQLAEERADENRREQFRREVELAGARGLTTRMEPEEFEEFQSTRESLGLPGINPAQFDEFGEDLFVPSSAIQEVREETQRDQPVDLPDPGGEITREEMQAISQLGLGSAYAEGRYDLVLAEAEAADMDEETIQKIRSLAEDDDFFSVQEQQASRNIIDAALTSRQLQQRRELAGQGRDNQLMDLREDLMLNYEVFDPATGESIRGLESAEAQVLSSYIRYGPGSVPDEIEPHARSLMENLRERTEGVDVAEEFLNSVATAGDSSHRNYVYSRESAWSDFFNENEELRRSLSPGDSPMSRQEFFDWWQTQDARRYRAAWTLMERVGGFDEYLSKRRQGFNYPVGHPVLQAANEMTQGQFGYDPELMGTDTTSGYDESEARFSLEGRRIQGPGEGPTEEEARRDAREGLGRVALPVRQGLQSTMFRRLRLGNPEQEIRNMETELSMMQGSQEEVERRVNEHVSSLREHMAEGSTVLSPGEQDRLETEIIIWEDLVDIMNTPNNGVTAEWIVRNVWEPAFEEAVRMVNRRRRTTGEAEEMPSSIP